jgi:diaminohydroxyphosphoribosylaminopyrimidine deaminase/5-amino-6-(5-phosphoribosylamino)uracil reductase
MQRCLQLALLGAGNVAPNPVVGAVLVYNGKIIGEGYHRQYGGPHAEVNCINSVADADKELIEKSTLYVSLEPCAHYGKTPPCADLIIRYKIRQVVIGCRDSFEAVNARLNDAAAQGKGIERLMAAGIAVTVGILEKECRELNRRFFTFHEKQRPYIILKWAQSRDGKIAPLNMPAGRQVPKGGSLEHENPKRLMISNEFTNSLVHKWRTEEASILVGTNTALLDDPALTARLWPGKDPVRLVIDTALKLPVHLKLFDGSVKTIVFNYIKQSATENLVYHRLNKEEGIPVQIIAALYNMQLQSVMVEGGSKLLQSFIDEGSWDEARVITNTSMVIGEGLDAPVLKNEMVLVEQHINDDAIVYFKRAADK